MLASTRTGTTSLLVIVLLLPTAEVPGRADVQGCNRPWPPPGGRWGAMAVGTCWRSGLVVHVWSVRCTVSLYRSSPTVVISGYAFCIETKLPATTDGESPRAAPRKGHKAGLFAVRKPEEQAASFNFPVSFHTFCHASRASEHEDDVSLMSRHWHREASRPMLACSSPGPRRQSPRYRGTLL